ncbi:hypothetical protein PIROE2DRAFT_4393 [Piromyces sp. E2]|nr:hypothetical protein PIROE2DRAFT_4393 [Piromyces sp. E2]|eukprot:OUM67978.1 hypothetical protein PIROE2DRAFT_4393 [Piromyces sp. E2]
MKYYLLIALLLVSIVAADHGICRPEKIEDFFEIFKNGLGGEKEVYDCVVKDGNDNTKIACAVDIPVLTDDAIVFKVKRNSNGSCNKRVCQSGNTRINSYLYRGGYPGQRVSVLDLKRYKIKDYHICHRYQYGNDHCDVNFDLISYEYYDNAGRDFFKFVTKVLEWKFSKK